MKKTVSVIFLVAVMLTGCNTAKKVQQTTVNEPDVTARVRRSITPQPVVLDLTQLMPGDYAGRKVTINHGALDLTTDTEGKISFVMPETDTLMLSLSPCPDLQSACEVAVPVSGWVVPYTYVIRPGGTVERKSPWVEFRMTPEAVTSQPQFDFLCRSEYPATVSINGIPLKQYKTGIFFTTVKFNEGVNKVRAEATTPDGRTAFCEQEYIYEKRDMTRQPFPLWIDRRSFEPAADMELLPGEVVKVSFRGSRGQEAWLDIRPGKKTIKCAREDFEDYSIYHTEVPLRGFIAGVEHTLSVRLVSVAGAPVKDTYRPDLTGTVTVRNPEDFPLVKVKNDYSRLVYNLGAPRLGGPIRQELGPGVILKTSGKIGRNYRIRLSNTETGFIAADDVEPVSGSTVQPGFSVTSMTCGPSAGADVVTLPYLEPYL